MEQVTAAVGPGSQQKETTPQKVVKRTVTAKKESSLLSEVQHKDKDGKVVRRSTRLSKEGRARIREEWERAVIKDSEIYTASLHDIRSRGEAEIVHIRQLKDLAKVRKDDVEFTHLNLKELSFKKHLERAQRIKVRAEMATTTSPWQPVQELMRVKLFPDVPPALAETVVANYIATIKGKIDDSIFQSIQQGVALRDQETSFTVAYDREISKRVFDELLSLSPADGSSQKGALVQLTKRAVGEDVASFVREDIQKGTEDAKLAIIRRELQEPMLAFLSKDDGKHGKTIRAESIAEKISVPSRLVQRLKVLPHSLKRAAIQAALIGGVFLGGREMVPVIQAIQDVGKSSTPITLSVQAPSPTVEMVRSIPVANPVVRTQISSTPLFAEQQTKVVEPEIKPLPKKEETEIAKPVGPKQESTPIQVVKHEVRPPEVTQKKEVIPQSRVGIRVTEAHLMPETSKLGMDYVRIAGGGSEVKQDGKFIDEDIENLVKAADTEGKSTIFVFNPNQVPPFDQPGMNAPKNIEGFRQQEDKIKLHLSERLGTLITHKSIQKGAIVLGNEYNDTKHFWQGDAKTAAYMMKLSLDVLKEKGFTGKVIIGAIAEPSKNQDYFKTYISELKNQGVDLTGKIMAVHGYTLADLQTGVSLVKSVNARPFVDEVGVDRKRKDANAVLNSLVTYSLNNTSSDLPVMLHELKSFGVGDSTTGGVEYSVIPGSSLASEISRLSQTAEARNPAQLASAPINTNI